ncbi:MAG: hypothetical protein ACYTEQ_30605 [Planctomycetota bacterium]|jgi:hypothetical protein
MAKILSREQMRRRVADAPLTVEADASLATAGERALGAAVSNVGSAVGQVGAEFQRREAEVAARDARLQREEDENIASEAFQSAFPRVADNYNNISTGRDLPGLPEDQRKMSKLERYQTNFDRILDEVAADLTPDQKRIFQEKLMPTQVSNVKSLSRQEAIEAQAVRAVNYKDETVAYSDSLLDNPNTFDTYIADIPRRLEAAGVATVTEVDGRKIITNAAGKEAQAATEAQYAISAIRGMINKPTKIGDPTSGPGAAIAAIESGQFDDYLDQDQRKKMKKEAETYQKVFEQREKDKQKAQDEKIVDEWLVKMINGQIPEPRDLANPDLSKDGRKELLGLAKTYGTGGADKINKSDPTTYAQVQDLVFSAKPGELTSKDILDFRSKV